MFPQQPFRKTLRYPTIRTSYYYLHNACTRTGRQPPMSVTVWVTDMCSLYTVTIPLCNNAIFMFSEEQIILH